MKKKLRGFTLIELIIVVAIIGILMAIAVPQFTQKEEKSQTDNEIVEQGSKFNY